ncbi:MAG: thiamine-phosphate kinase [Alphaproteobacteria bacterium]
MGEFEIIERYFLPLTKDRKEAQGFQNDAAILDIPYGKQVVVTSDTLSEGTHFLDSQEPDTVASKALRTNLSDLAAMGAKPYCYQLCLSLPEFKEDWIAKFTHGLERDQNYYGLFLSGGDTTSIKGPLTISITAFGLVDEGKAVPRNGAKAGDLVFLTGMIGDAFCGLQALRGKVQNAGDHCVNLYYRPEPPVEFASRIGGVVNAAIDISYGLIADLGHIAKASQVSVVVELDSIVFSADVQALLDKNAVTKAQLLSGGDDYQLLMSVAPENTRNLEEIARESGVNLQQIGIIQDGEAQVLALDENGLPLEFDTAGWQHF